MVALALLAGCSTSSQSSATGPTTTTTFPKAFCAAATRYENELQREASADKRDPAKQLAIIDAAGGHRTAAGARGRPDVPAHASQMVQRDPKLRDDPAIKRAVDNVNRYASNRCGFFTQQGPGI